MNVKKTAARISEINDFFYEVERLAKNLVIGGVWIKDIRQLAIQGILAEESKDAQ